MLLNNKNNERLGIFIFYDRDGIVDDYVTFLLNDLTTTVNELIIVSNSKLSPFEKAKLSKFTDKIKIRENVGLDAGAFKDIYDEYKEYIKSFDEVILLNDTFFGPFIPFKTIIKDMAKKDIDFWGLSACYDSPDGFGYLPDKMIHNHIQTFFIVFRNNVLNSEAFNTYWENYNIKKMKSFDNVVTKHEIVFTHYLEEAGFKWDIYTDLSKYKSSELTENFNTYAYASYDLIKNYHCPFLKKKNFSFPKSDVLYLSDGEDLKKTFNYLKENNIYDTEMIWKYIIRICKTEDIYFNLNLNYIIEEDKENKNYAIVLKLEEEKYIEYYVNLLKHPPFKNYFVFTNNKNIKNILETKKIKITSPKDFHPEKYDYIGVINDFYQKHQQINLAYEMNFNSFILNGFENQEYVNGVGKVFLNNPHIGALILPISYHSNYFADIANYFDIINCNCNACFIRSELFDLDTISEDYFVQKILNNLQNNNFVVGKIFNKKALSNILINQEYTIKETYRTLCTYHRANTNSITEARYHLKHTRCHRALYKKVIIRLYRIVIKIYYKWFWK